MFYGAAEFSRDTDLAILADAANLSRLRAAAMPCISAVGILKRSAWALMSCQFVGKATKRTDSFRSMT